MAHDFEDIHDIGDLGDEELRDLARSTLASHDGIDVNDITVHVERGAVRLLGRVGTDVEARVAERLLTDVLGIPMVRNELIVDALRRAESPEAADEHDAYEESREGLLLGDREVPLVAEAEHLEENLDERLYGTTDVGNAIESGTPWTPPDRPTPEGHSDASIG